MKEGLNSDGSADNLLPCPKPRARLSGDKKREAEYSVRYIRYFVLYKAIVTLCYAKSMPCMLKVPYLTLNTSSYFTWCYAINSLPMVPGF